MSSKKLLHVFPTPTFLDVPCAGLSLSDRHIRALQFDVSNRSTLKIKKYIALPVAEGAITSGRVNNKEEIIRTLKELKKQTGIEYVRVSLPEEKAYVFEVEIPILPPKEIKSAIQFKLEENVPWPADQVVFDYAVIEEDASHGHLRVVVLVLPTKFIDIYMEMLNAAGLIPHSLEIESQAFARALLPRGDMGTYLIVHFGREKIGLCVVSKEVVHFTSTLSLPADLRTNPDSFASEIAKVIAYWQTKHNTGENKDATHIAKVIVCGHDFEESVVSYLASFLKINTELGNVWINAFDINKTLPELPFSDSLTYASAIGLALPSDSLI